MTLLEFILKSNHNKKKEVQLFYDIETLTVNRSTKFPSDLKTYAYSWAVSYTFDGKKIYYEVFPSLKKIIDIIINHGSKNKNYVFISQNGNKYDNHFLRYYLNMYYAFRISNMYLSNAKKSENEVMTIKKTSVEDENIILEKRVKSSTNLEMFFKLENHNFYTLDVFPKSLISLEKMGRKLYEKGLITEEYLKTDYNYTKFDKFSDFETFEEVEKYCLSVFNNLNKDELKYIRNDVIILALFYHNYSSLMYGFSIDKPTFTSNVKDMYITNPLAEFHLLLTNKEDDYHLKYSDYQFNNMNMFDYAHGFYVGGLNFYNDKVIGQILEDEDGYFSLDINSSYPYVMYTKKAPTFLEAYSERPIKFTFKKDDEFYYFICVSSNTFNILLDTYVKSRILRQMFVKYFRCKNGIVYLTSPFFRYICELAALEEINFVSESFLKYSCMYFGGRETINEFYKIKTCGRSKTIVKYKDPLHIVISDEPNKEMLDLDDILRAKTGLNGIYGIPALSLYFDLFQLDAIGKLVNVENGFINKERNVLFSAYVTSYAFYNLLSPLLSLSSEEIDENFIYCDTDSLYLSRKIYHKIDSNIFDPNIIGKWDIENEHIKKMYVLNHKKYAYLVNDKIKVKSGGIRLSSFNLNSSFENFVQKQFSDGVEITTLKSILNKNYTISLYDSKTLLQKGKTYPEYIYLEDMMNKEILINELKEDMKKDSEGETLYFETSQGTITRKDLQDDLEIPKKNIEQFISKQNEMRKKL